MNLFQKICKKQILDVFQFENNAVSSPHINSRTLQISELHSKYLEQGRELGEAEKLSQSADNMRGLVERLTIENEEVTRQNNQLSLQTAEYEKVGLLLVL